MTDAETPLSKATRAATTHPQTAIAWALVAIAGTLAVIQRDLHKIANRRG